LKRDNKKSRNSINNIIIVKEEIFKKDCLFFLFQHYGCLQFCLLTCSRLSSAVQVLNAAVYKHTDTARLTDKGR